jgi:hypothetical protein
MASNRHTAQLYLDADQMAGTVAQYLAAGLADGAPALLLVTPAQAELIRSRLGETDGRLVVLDAEEVVAGGVPSAADFERVVGGAIDELAARFPEHVVRVYGEAVDVLMARGEHAAAISLEELWNSLAWSRRFTLLCGYRHERFDDEAGAAALPEVERTHSHVAFAV